jgi:hypothetical protein
MLIWFELLLYFIWKLLITTAVVISLIFFWNILGLFLKQSFQWYALYEIIFLREKKFHRNYVLNDVTSEIVCAQYKRGNSSLYLVFLLICQFIIECTDVDAFIAALDIGLLRYLIRFLWLFCVERLLIGHFLLNVLFNYFSFFVNRLNLTFLLLLSVNRKYDIFRVGHLLEFQLLEIFKVWPF